MSRFTNWTMADIEKLTSGKLRSEAITSKPVDIKSKQPLKLVPDYPGMIAAALKVLGINCIREYKFLHDRRFRFDIAIPEYHLAIEFEGGTFATGGHSRGKGYAKDTKKYNLANMNGWKLLRYSTDDVRGLMWEYKIAGEIERFIKNSVKDNGQIA